MSSRFYAGIDVGGTSAKVALVGDDGQILMRRRFPTGHDLSVDRFVDLLSREKHALAAEASRLGGSLQGMALGIPGLVDAAGRPHAVVNLPSLSNHDLPGILETSLALPVVVLNDATAAAYGEFIHGAGRGFGSLLLVTLGTGIGGGLILNQDLWTGADGMAGEVGHLTVEPDGRPCSCGSHGCLEQYASASAIGEAWLRSLGEAVPAGASTAEAAKGAAEAARGGDSRALAIFAAAGRYLGIAVAGIANLLNLEAVLLSGGLAASSDLLLDSLSREVSRRAFYIPARRLVILPGSLADDAGVVGAIAYMKRYPDGLRKR